MDRNRQQQEFDAHFAALRKFDTVTLMYRGRVARGRAVRSLQLRTARKLRAIAGSLWSWLASQLPRRELARYDDRLLRDMGVTRYDVQTRSGTVTDTIATWLDRSRQRRRLAGFSDRDLRDIAISKCDAQAEIEKPFWRA